MTDVFPFVNGASPDIKNNYLVFNYFNSWGNDSFYLPDQNTYFYQIMDGF